MAALRDASSWRMGFPFALLILNVVGDGNGIMEDDIDEPGSSACWGMVRAFLSIGLDLEGVFHSDFCDDTSMIPRWMLYSL